MRVRKGDERWTVKLAIEHDRGTDDGQWLSAEGGNRVASAEVVATAEHFGQAGDEAMVALAMLDRLRLEAHELLDRFFSGEYKPREIPRPAVQLKDLIDKERYEG